jgi:hypothetical protein
MSASARSYFMGGIAVVCASVIAIASAVAPPPDVTVPANRPVATQVLSEATVELLAAAQRMAPVVVSPAPAVTAAAAAPAPQNAASDLIITAWNAVLPWIDYGVNLTDYVLGFIPYGYLIGDQVSIVYYSLVRPVANTFVVNLLAPVVNAPLNINSYLNGLVALGSVTVTSLINLGINEFNYFFGWLIPPIPPIGLAAEAAAAELTTTALAAPTSVTPEETATVVEKHSTAATDATAAAETKETATPPPKESTSAVSGTVQAQGEVREPATSTEKAVDTTKASSDDSSDKGDKPETAKPATKSAPSPKASDHEIGKDDTGKKK